MGIARLVGIQTICRMCHFAEHPGFVNVMIGQGRFSPTLREEVEQHFCKVNGCTPSDYHRHLEEAQCAWDELMRVRAWRVDFGPYAGLVPEAVIRAAAAE